MCGRVWAVTTGGDGGPLDEFDETAFAPTCKRCLALMDEEFPEPRDHEQLPLVAQLTADIVLDRSSTFRLPTH